MGKIKIDQAGLTPAGTAGKSRTDGKADGSLVTLTNTDPQGLTEFRLLWKPPEDTTAEASLAASSADVWTFSPTVGAYGTYVVQLLEGGIVRERRVLRVRLPLTGLAIPALNERASETATLADDGSEQVEASDDNATDYGAPLDAYAYAGWQRTQDELYRAVETVEGTPGPQGPDGNTGATGATGATGSIPPLPSSGDAGYLQLIILTPANDGLTWSTAAEVPDGDDFDFVATGPGGGAQGGSIVCGVNTTGIGGAGGGGGARPPPLRVPRAWVIAQLPITFTIGTGGTGGPRRSTSTFGSNLGGFIGGNGSKATRIDGASGLLLFAGAGAGGAQSSTLGGGGGGCNGNGSAGTGGLPDDATAGVAAGGEDWWFGGSDNRSSEASRDTARHGGGGGAFGTNSAGISGNDSLFGGGGGASGGRGTGVSGLGLAGAKGGAHDIFIQSSIGAGAAGAAGSAGDAGGGANGDFVFAGCGGGSGGGVGASDVIKVRGGDGGNGGNPGGGGGGGGGMYVGSGTATGGSGGNGGNGEILITIWRSL